MPSDFALPRTARVHEGICLSVSFRFLAPLPVLLSVVKAYEAASRKCGLH